MNNSILISIFVCVVILLSGVAGFYFMEVEPVDQKAKDFQAKIKDKEEKLAGFSNIEKEIEKLKNEIKTLEDDKKKLQTETIKLDEVVPKLLDSTESVSNKFDVKFQDIRISPLVRAEDWSELPVEMTILGTFDNISNFLIVMEKRKLINLAAGSMNVSVSSEVDKLTGSPMLSVNLSAKVYIL